MGVVGRASGEFTDDVETFVSLRRLQSDYWRPNLTGTGHTWIWLVPPRSLAIGVSTLLACSCSSFDTA